MIYTECMKDLLLIDKQKLVDINAHNSKVFKQNGIGLIESDMVLDINIPCGFRLSYSAGPGKYNAVYRQTISEFTGDVIWDGYYNDNSNLLEVINLILNKGAHVSISLIENIFNIINHKYFKEHFEELNGEDLLSIHNKLNALDAYEMNKAKIAEMDKKVEAMITELGGQLFDFSFRDYSESADSRCYNVKVLAGGRNWWSYGVILDLYNNREKSKYYKYLLR